jgi:hypothetical protein
VTRDTRITAKAVLLVAGVGAPVVFGLGVLLGSRDIEGYSHVHDYVSELGARGLYRRDLVNTSFFGTGALLAVFGLALMWLAPRWRPAGWTLVVVAAGFVTAAFASCSPRCPRPGDDGYASNDVVHMIGAAAVFVGFVAAPALVARSARNSGREASLRRISRIATVTVGMAVIAMFVTGGVDQYVGLAQRASDLAFFAWLVTIAIMLGRSPLPVRGS